MSEPNWTATLERIARRHGYTSLFSDFTTAIITTTYGDAATDFRVLEGMQIPPPVVTVMRTTSTMNEFMVTYQAPHTKNTKNIITLSVTNRDRGER